MKTPIMSPWFFNVFVIILFFSGLVLIVISRKLPFGVDLLAVDHTFAYWGIFVFLIVLVRRKFGYQVCPNCGHSVFHPGKDGEYGQLRPWPFRVCNNCGQSLTDRIGRP